jgi:hypothetical protein
MLELPHTIVGATIATKIPNPLISLPLAFFSHFFLDLIPHWNPSLYSETKKFGKPTQRSTQFVILDTILSLGVGFFLASRALPNINQAIIIVLACFASVVADVIEGFYFFLGIRTKFLENLIEFQHRYQRRVPIVPGLLIQLGAIIISLFFLA